MSCFLFQSQSGGGGGSASSKYQQDIGVTQAVPVGLSFGAIDPTIYQNGVFRYQIHRTTSGNTTVGEIGNIAVFNNIQGASLWEISREVLGTYGATFNTGVSFQINSSGLPLFTAAEWDSTGYTGFITYQFLNRLEK